jgi:hypothetical protein
LGGFTHTNTIGCGGKSFFQKNDFSRWDFGCNGLQGVTPAIGRLLGGGEELEEAGLDCP